MQSVNNLQSGVYSDFGADTRHQIARLTALTLVLSYAELLVPRVIPFFRLGLGNAALLMGLGLTFPVFMLLSVIKSVAANLMAGTLFSPFFLVSLAQSLASALVMFAMGRTTQVPRVSQEHAVSLENSEVRHNLLSLYGISVAGSAVSAAVQISLSSLYLGQGTWSLLGPMLLFNAVSGVITAWLAEMLGGGSLPLAPKTVVSTPSTGSGTATTVFSATPSAGTPLRCLRSKLGYNAPDSSGSHTAHRPRNILRLAIILAAAASVFFIKNTAILCGLLLLSFLAQKFAGRKILLLPHLSLWLFVLVTSVLVPNGRVLFSVAGFSITGGALLTGLQKALRLSTVSALSQCAVTIQPKENTILALSLNYYKLMLDSFQNTQGSIITKLKAAFGMFEFTQQPEPSQNQNEER